MAVRGEKRRGWRKKKSGQGCTLPAELGQLKARLGEKRSSNSLLRYTKDHGKSVDRLN